MPYRVEIEPIVPGGIRRVAFDFAPFLAADEVLDSYTVVINLVSGVDDDPNEVLGDNSVAGVVVYQFLAPTIEGNVYSIQAVATTTEGQIVTLSGHLACVETFDKPDVSQVTTGVGTIVASYSTGPINYELPPTVILDAQQTRNGGRFQLNYYFAVVESLGMSGGIVNGLVHFYGVETGDEIIYGIGGLNFNTLNTWWGDTKMIEVAPETQVRVDTFFSSMPGSGIFAYILSVEVVQLA